MKKFRKPLLFALCLVPVALAAGWFTAQYSLASVEPSILEAALEQAGSRDLLVAATVVQTVLYAVFCGFFGYLLAEKLGLMRPFRFEKTITIRVLLVSVLCGILLSLDAWTFVKWIPELGASDAGAGGFDLTSWLSAILYGGVIEEVMMRLFVMSLQAFLGWKLFCRKQAEAPTGVLIAANVLAALLFAAGHLPGTLQFFGRLTPLLLLRCFLLNGAFGLVFGRFYRKYGIQYAMLAHMLCHIVSKTIWLIFL